MFWFLPCYAGPVGSGRAPEVVGRNSLTDPLTMDPALPFETQPCPQAYIGSDSLVGPLGLCFPFLQG